MAEKVIYNPLVHRKPFCLIQANGDRKVYTRDELKRMGTKYDLAAKNSIISMKAEEVVKS